MQKMKYHPLLLLMLTCYFTAVCTEKLREFKCMHDASQNQIKTKVRMSSSRQVNNDFSERFRILINYDNSVNEGLNSEVRMRLKNVIIPELTDYLQSSLFVRPLPGPILLDRDCNDDRYLITDTELRYCAQQCAITTMCGPSTIPSEHLKRCGECDGSNFLSQCTEYGSDGEGADASFILYVSAITYALCPTEPISTETSTIAFASACQIEDQFDRPIAGYVNFCPFYFDGDVTDDFIMTVTKHEVLHALGFSSILYPFWRDENGDPRTPRDSNGFPPFDGNRFVASESTVKEVTYDDWSTRTGTVDHTVTLLVTPKIVEEGRRHFNCPSLEGVELENQGGPGTAFVHWEKRIVENEGMTGVLTQNAVFSRFTFALLEDSGWYKVNYDNAGQLPWGRGSGCEFASGSCGGYINSQKQKNSPISPFCDYLNDLTNPITRVGCTYDRLARSYCNLIEYSSTRPSEYQYLTSGANFDSSSTILSFLGGMVETADFCPYQRSFLNGDCSDTDNLLPQNPFAETYSSDSRCVYHGGSWIMQNSEETVERSDLQSGCYKYTCFNGQVTLHILDESYNCTTTGELININQTSNGTTYTGSIICPSCLEICYDDFENCPEAAELYMNSETTEGALAVASCLTTVLLIGVMSVVINF